MEIQTSDTSLAQYRRFCHSRATAPPRLKHRLNIMTKLSRRVPPQQHKRTLAGAAKSPLKRAHSSASTRRKRNRGETETPTLRPRRRRRESSGAESSRKWVDSSFDTSSFKDKLVIVSYNILGVENASNHQDLYVNVADEYLEWNRRKKLIHKEISRYEANILCLQEVDRFDDLSRLFRKDGFEGVYKARTGEASDGCAVFWKQELITLLHQENIEFQRFGLRNNVAQLCVLEMKNNESDSDPHTQLKNPHAHKRSFVIGNIHVLFNPNRGDIKLGQVRLLLEKASQLSREWGYIPVIICGDLNTIPQSPIYQFLASSKLDIRLYDRRKISGQVEFESNCRAFRSSYEKAISCRSYISKPLFHRWSEEELRLATGNGRATHLQHQLKLSSAYPDVPGCYKTRDDCGEPFATSFHSKFMGTVDYIWHSKELVPIRVLETLPLDVLKRTGGLPSKKWGSDHLALVCELGFTDNGT